MRLLTLLLIAVPLSAQQTQTTVVPDVNVQVEPTPIVNEINVEVMSDSVRDARIAAALESIATEIAAQGCDQCGSSTVVRVGQSTLIAILGFAAWQLKKIADKKPGDDIHNDGDTNIENTVNLPKHPPHDHDSESGEN